ncbi:hypothetical protein [Paracoccus alkanivorans]|uniref:Uncharacterized protein n=1 Tax=Paracoccus alkanivorans TaxID=2116655 RepID=A0A3M0M946_9RHOB|nr:hypothetical protein [Paracoccus alkanivorans]RMC33763.1 hypothetical protein C9E81_15800 [Paracoccus alkanivorans]
MSNKIVHIHIGVDAVSENIIGDVMQAVSEDVSESGYHFINDDEFELNFKNAISAADGTTAEEAVKKFSDSADVLVFSRPKFLYTGAPLNFGDVYKKAIYKFNFLQSIFSGFDVVFHLFIVDHVSYLSNHLKTARNTSPVEVIPSWIPMISGLKSCLLDNSQLIVWNAERPDWIISELCKSVSGGRIVTDIMASAATESRVAGRKKERLLSNAGWDPELLDDLFEQDLQYIHDGDGVDENQAGMD